MNISMYLKLFIVTLFFISRLSGFAQSKPNLEEMEEKYKSGKVSNEDFIQYADSVLTDFFFSKGGSMSNDSLIRALSTYRNIVSKDNLYKKQRGLYYYYLASNANNQGLGGLLIYYSEKYRTEIGRNSFRAIIPLSFIINYYNNNNQYKNILELYYNDKPYLDQQETDIFMGPSLSARLKTILGIYYIVGIASVKEQKIAPAKNLLKKMYNLHDKVIRSKDTEPFDIAISSSFLTINKVAINLYENKLDSVYLLLSENIAALNKFKDTYPDEVSLYIGYCKEVLLQYYKKTGKEESIIQLLETMKYPYPEFQMFKSKESALAHYDLGNFRAAADLLLDLNQLQENRLLSKANETNNLLYSYIEAERNKADLIEAEKENKLRLFLILVIGTVFIFTSCFFYYTFTSQKRQLKLLNRTTEVQINDAIQRASKEERNKIGQDLHDGLSGSMAGILYHLEDIKTKTVGSEVSPDINQLYDKLQLVSKELRHKSHVNFNAVYDTREDSLEASVQKIVNSALKPNTKREIEIDTKTSVLLDTSIRIEILRIVQEALTNIVKHAKKVTEVFVYLYENEGSVYLEIGNNGVISARKNSDGIGIRSIKSRVSALGGESKIEYEAVGFKIEIKLPKPIHL